MRIAALAGGTGGAKLLVGLERALDPVDLTAIVNTADDDVIYDVHVSPDVDMVTYWLAGVADADRGWGIRGDTFNLVEWLERLGEPAWFRLGDRDHGTCLLRTQRLAAGATLSAVTDEIRRRLGVAATIIPMSDEPVRTRITTPDGRELTFQEYFVKERQQPVVDQVLFDGIGDAKPAPGVIEAISSADRVVITPSNPIVSIEPILGIAGIREALREHPSVIAVSPLIRGAALKGPADRMMRSLGAESSAVGVAEIYGDICDTYVIDSSEDDSVHQRLETRGVQVRSLDTIMSDASNSERLARAILAL